MPGNLIPWQKELSGYKMNCKHCGTPLDEWDEECGCDGDTIERLKNTLKTLIVHAKVYVEAVDQYRGRWDRSQTRLDLAGKLLLATIDEAEREI